MSRRALGAAALALSPLALAADAERFQQRLDWWSFRPLVRPAVPRVEDAANPIDAFIKTTLAERGLALAPAADRRTLLRRLSFDLLGLPPDPEEIDAFVADSSPDAWKKWVDHYLRSPRHGERWARHWLDVIHYGETHGYDKDQPRPNAWPYRDYVIRSLNADKPFDRFVHEQIAGDALFPGTSDGLEALGFIAAGPWDLIGHAELPETKIDGRIARMLDRDDMVASTLQTFCALTVQCARCHDHKFDPVTSRDYYRLAAVFAALDRADKTYDTDPTVAARRAALQRQRTQLSAQESPPRPEFGWHSQLASTADTAKWVQLDLGRTTPLERLSLHPCHDDFGGIGDGFGFPPRFKVELSDDPDFRTGVINVGDWTQADVPNPKLRPFEVRASGRSARYVRITATKLAARTSDFMFALAEVAVVAAGGKNAAAGATVTSLDTLEAPPRWQAANLTDGWHPRGPSPEWTAVNDELAKLPAPRVCYVGCVHHGTGSFRGTGPEGGRPRPIFVLHRGDVTQPLEEVAPGTVPLIPGSPPTFALAPDAPESARRAALANWVTDARNPLTWRVIVNRVWHTHFGRGLVETGNDFGHMGALPSHPQLLDWLACEFRDGRRSLKDLHRLIVSSATYQQACVENPTAAAVDADNRLLWRVNRRKLDAESWRDAVLAVAGKLDLTMGGPSFRDFIIGKPEHSPHYQYHLADIEDARLHRRAIYRFLVRSQPQPLMAALDCADPSMSVDRRNETNNALQALALFNNRLTVAMARHFAARVHRETGDDHDAAVARAVQLALGRNATDAERHLLAGLARTHGLGQACRAILNLNEFVFVD